MYETTGKTWSFNEFIGEKGIVVMFNSSDYPFALYFQVNYSIENSDGSDEETSGNSKSGGVII